MTTLKEASARADTGSALAAEKADRLEEGWVERAAEDLRSFAATTPRPFLIEEARAHCRPTPEGADQRAWGAVTRRAITLKYIERVPGFYAPAASSNGSPKPAYRRGPAV